MPENNKNMLLVQARNYTTVPTRNIRLIVLHTMEAPEKPGTALAVAKWFASSSAPQASAHYCVDDANVVQCVQEHDVAWGAPGANKDGIHIEHAGYAAQTPTQWRDDFSLRMLETSSQVAAEIAQRWAIPLRKLSVPEVRDGKTMGFCGHRDVSVAFARSTHTDPGVNFPWDDYMALVRDAFEGL